MFLETSRYYKIPQVEARARNGRTTKAVKLRRLPPTAGTITTVNKDDRLDVIAHRQYNQSDRFWHIADANTELEANDLVRESGQSVKIPEN